MDERVNPDDLIYRYRGNTSNKEFNKYDNALDLIDKIWNGEIKPADARDKQNNFKLNLGEIKKGGKKSKEQRNTIYNVEMLYKARKEAIKFFDNYSLMISEAKNKSKKTKKTSGKGHKILTPKQMLQRLPIALAQVKTGNNSENVLNEIRQIVYSLYQSKEITKKVYNNLIKSL